MNNVMDANKLAYIKGMRIELCEQDILKRGTGELNVKYFNVKKGSYWSEREDELLLQLVLKFGPTNFEAIRNHDPQSCERPCKDDESTAETEKRKPLSNWTETEIRLRISKLLRVYDLTPYEKTIFASKEEIAAEAAKNKVLGKDANALKGGVWFNPPASRDNISVGTLNAFMKVKSSAAKNAEKLEK